MGAQQSKDQHVFYGEGVPVKVTGELLSALDSQVTDSVEATKTVEEQVQEKVAYELSRFHTEQTIALEQAQQRGWSSSELKKELSKLEDSIDQYTSASSKPNAITDISNLEKLQQKVAACYTKANKDNTQLDCWKYVDDLLLHAKKSTRERVASF
ncbi:hypothetical protein BB560_001316 [Smittium megazygosporum]|uniref:MICOS complex subunit MIC19 n=1 Tax=Smittium megazygosporum TaxID=133381 RepID=A0A2T9ZHX4_9FUNG|nr:hypothetical protein BB560_006808 [Smittium megazygosporum]PVV03660.1 hypothetical protein BB560_001863 [Smittium megazygosporum]PVV04192.1 hypothetical protein BB560_001316 [Smittium megazygosporum]